MSDFKLTTDMIGMNNREYYDPEICDGHYCCRDCEKCDLLDEILEKLEAEEGYNAEPSDSDLEMGFDPYLGCYTDDC